MPALTITLLEPGMTLQTLGALPDMLEANDPAPAREQLGRRYQHGFRGRSGRYLDADDVLHFPGDRPLSAACGNADARRDNPHFRRLLRCGQRA
jgi:hypothetical protein